MHCPNCSKETADSSVECPVCGIVFAKWKEREERIRSAATIPLPSPAQPISRTRRAAKVFVWVMAVGWAAWVVFLLTKYSSDSKKIKIQAEYAQQEMENSRRLKETIERATHIDPIR